SKRVDHRITTTVALIASPRRDRDQAGSALRPESHDPLEAGRVDRPDLRVEEALRAFAVEDVEHLLGGDGRHVGARLSCYPGGVRTRDHVVEGEQWVVVRRRFLVPYIKAGAGDATLAQRCRQRPFVMDAAPRGGDEIGV